MNTIILTGGGTAGHITPNLALIPKLKTFFNRIVYIGSFDGMEKNILKNYPEVEFYPITTVKLVRKLTLQNLKIPFLLHKGVKEASQILKKVNPSVIFSKGGFVSLPVVFAASKQKIPVILHESDFSIGLSNKLSVKKAKKVLTTFPQTAHLLKNGMYVGCPVKQSLFNQNAKQVLTELNICTTKPILLIIGGSLGSVVLNNIIYQSLTELTKKFYVIHITGKGKKSDIKAENYLAFEFYEHIEKLFAITNFAITRGGSNTIWELFSLQIPMLIIPLSKKISRGDQIQNALYFEKQNYGICLFEDELSKENLLLNLEKLCKNKQTYVQAMKKDNNKDALDKIFNCICECSQKK